MSDRKIIAVTGATGAQGGGLARSILNDPDGGTLSFHVALADTTRLPGAVIHQVAAPNDTLRSVAEYSVEFSR